jgi:hypothetical protein
MCAFMPDQEREPPKRSPSAGPGPNPALIEELRRKLGNNSAARALAPPKAAPATAPAAPAAAPAAPATAPAANTNSSAMPDLGGVSAMHSARAAGDSGSGQQSIQILYQGPDEEGRGSHDVRAVSLQAWTPGSGVADVEKAAPARLPKLTTLTFWGHGALDKHCNLEPADMVKTILAWKKLNPGLNRVEFVTCNIRHYGESIDPKDMRAYADRVKSKLTSSRAGRDIALMGMPVAPTGKKNNWSILLAEPYYESWVYVTGEGKTDQDMHRAAALLKTKPDANGQLELYKGDMAVRAQEILADPQHANRTWTYTYGHFSDLRNILVPI